MTLFQIIFWRLSFPILVVHGHVIGFGIYNQSYAMINLKHFSIFLRLGGEKSYQDSSESEVEVAKVTKNAEVAEDTAIMVEVDKEISFLPEIPDDPVSLEAEGFNNIIKEILAKKKLEEEVKSSMKDLIDNVEKAVQPSKKRSNFRKQPINKPTWIVNKRKKAHESGQEYVNNKGS